MLLTADQPLDNYWITLTQQFRKGAPNGYAILHYEGAANATLPTTPTPQPSTVKPESLSQVNQVQPVLKPGLSVGRRQAWCA